MPKKSKKKSWKERQRERQVKQQRAQESYQKQRELEVERKPRKWPKGKILVAVIFLVVILGVYGIYQYVISSPPSNGPPPTSEIIYITPDGQVTPPTASILNNGNNHYTLTADVYNSIIILKNNIILDGANHAVQGAGIYGSKGLDLTGRSNVTVRNVKIKGFDYGIYLSSASNNVLSQNDLTNNYCGIWIATSSNNNLVSGNNMAKNEMYAIFLKESSNNNISGNIFTLHGNYTIYARHSNYTTFSTNQIAENNLGIFFFEASDNILYHNNFMFNKQHVAVSTSTNVWDNSYPSGGNYWSDYEEKYPNAEKLDDSGIWNTPYAIDENNQDNYPSSDLWALD